jgi:hypothetical protein
MYTNLQGRWHERGEFMIAKQRMLFVFKRKKQSILRTFAFLGGWRFICQLSSSRGLQLDLSRCWSNTLDNHYRLMGKTGSNTTHLSILELSG